MAVNESMGTSSSNDTTAVTTRVVGQRGEERAARYLEKNGLRVLERNFRCRGGEIDLVCRDRSSLVFVEVRLRRSEAFGGAGASIGAGKRQRIILAAQHYLARNAQADADCRFDCVLIDGSGGERMEWIRDAFAAS